MRPEWLSFRRSSLQSAGFLGKQFDMMAQSSGPPGADRGSVREPIHRRVEAAPLDPNPGYQGAAEHRGPLVLYPGEAATPVPDRFLRQRPIYEDIFSLLTGFEG